MRRASLVAVVVVALLAAAAPAQAVKPPAVPTRGALWGAFPNEPGGIPALQARVGRRLAIVNRYVPWDFSNWSSISDYLRTGHLPMVSWSAAPKTTASAIASGSQDSVIIAAARALKHAGGRVFLRPFYEFDQPPGHPRYIGAPSEVRAAWRRLANIFRSVGARNVRLVWCPMAADFHDGIAKSFYPGDRYVNWVGADGYNFPGKTWRPFKDIFQRAYHFTYVHAKRMIIAETASPAADPRTPRWMVGAAKWIRHHTYVHAVSYFDSTSPKGFNFQVATNARTLAAFRAWGLRRYFHQ
ncbi:MAG TPA: glycosyl hydrolase [Gaiellales bacterium]|nr:glycosyl hydrolase [Gaiellales bacterium]